MVDSALQCVHCHTEVELGDRYCATCGAALKGQPISPSYATGEFAGRSWYPVLLALLCVVLFCGSAVGSYALLKRRSSPRPMSLPVSLGEPRVPQPATAPPRWPSWWQQPDAGPPVTVAIKPKRAAERRRVIVQVPKSPRTQAPRAPVSDSGPPPHPTEEAADATTGSARQGDSGVSEADQLRGRINAGSVRMVVRHHLPQIQLCYDRALKRGLAIRGGVEILLVLTGDGRVRSSEVFRNTTGHQGLGKCIAYTMKRWRFPRPLGGVETEVIYPFAFGPARNAGSR